MSYISVKDHGAQGNALTDDAAAIRSAIAAAGSGGTLYFPEGQYLFGSTLDFRGVIHVVGADRAHSVLLAAASVRDTAVVFDSDISVEHLRIDGSRTTDVVGVRIGNDRLAAKISLRDVFITSFRGVARGCCVSVRNVVELLSVNCYFTKGGRASVMVEPATGSFPTMCTFLQTQFRDATRRGLHVTTAYQLSCIACVFENNGEEGAYVAPTAGNNAVDIGFAGCWFEGNGAAGYHLKGDGAARASTCRIRVRDTYFSGGNTGVRAIHLLSVSDWVLDNPVMFPRAGNVLIEGNGVGSVSNWPARSNGVYASTVRDATNQTASVGGDPAALGNGWIAWTPTYRSDGNMRFAAATSPRARYKAVGSLLAVQCRCIGTTSGSPAGGILIDLPQDVTIANTGMRLPALVTDGRSNVPAVVEVGGTRPAQYLKVTRADGLLWTIGTGREIHFSGFFELG